MDFWSDFLLRWVLGRTNVRWLDSLLNNWTICSLDIFMSRYSFFFHWTLADASEFRLLRFVAFSLQLLHPAPHYWSSTSSRCWNKFWCFLFVQSACKPSAPIWRGIAESQVGISALFFITLSNILLKSTTFTFLLILALGTFCLMLSGFLFVWPIPLPEHFSFQLEPEDGDVFRGPTHISSSTLYYIIITTGHHYLLTIPSETAMFALTSPPMEKT